MGCNSMIIRLYTKGDKCIKRAINIEEKLYSELQQVRDNDFECTMSELINICIEDYANQQKHTFYKKPDDEEVSYRNILIRKSNLEYLQELSETTGITMTRHLNSAINNFLITYNSK